MDGGAWWAAVHGVAKSRTRLSDITSLHFTSLHFVRDKRRETQTQRTSHIMRKAEMRGRGPQAQGLLEPLKLEKAGRTSSWSPWRAAPP